MLIVNAYINNICIHNRNFYFFFFRLFQFILKMMIFQFYTYKIIYYNKWKILVYLIYSSGIEEAANAGKTLKLGNYMFDVGHTSVLTRAQDTLCTILDELNQSDIPIYTTWRLNERHYGGLTGLDKSETAAKYGEKQVNKYS